MSQVKLQSQHLLITADLAREVSGKESYVFAVYYPAQKALILAPVDDPVFPTLHKAGQLLVKTKNLQGDKSISIREILIDHEVPDHDRDLVFLHQPGLRMLHISL